MGQGLNDAGEIVVDGFEEAGDFFEATYGDASDTVNDFGNMLSQCWRRDRLCGFRKTCEGICCSRGARDCKWRGCKCS
jgi:hypothetical protein